MSEPDPHRAVRCFEQQVVIPTYPNEDGDGQNEQALSAEAIAERTGGERADEAPTSPEWPVFTLKSGF